MALTDADLVRRAVAGQARAFDQLVDRYYARCLRFAWRQLGERAEAEEAVQDAFLRSHRALGTCAPERFKPWLMSIVVNCCRTYSAKMRRRAARFAPLDEVSATHSAVPTSAGFTGIEGSALEDALGRLSPALREVFLLKHVEEMTYEEISGLTGVGVSALKMRVKRAGELLTRALETARD